MLPKSPGIHLQNMSWYFGYDMLAEYVVEYKDGAQTHTRAYKICFGNRKLLWCVMVKFNMSSYNKTINENLKGVTWQVLNYNGKMLALQPQYNQG